VAMPTGDAIDINTLLHWIKGDRTGRGDPRETVTDYTRTVLGVDLPGLASTVELA
jgi:hypothetical protein